MKKKTLPISLMGEYPNSSTKEQTQSSNIVLQHNQLAFILENQSYWFTAFIN